MPRTPKKMILKNYFSFLFLDSLFFRYLRFRFPEYLFDHLYNKIFEVENKKYVGLCDLMKDNKQIYKNNSSF